MQQLVCDTPWHAGERWHCGQAACSARCVGGSTRQLGLHHLPGFFFSSPFFLFCLPDGKTKAVVKPVFSQEEVGGNFI